MTSGRLGIAGEPDPAEAVDGGGRTRGRVWSALDRFDDTVDGAFDRIRGVPAADATAAVISNLADYGFVWSVVAGVKGFHRGPARRRARRALTLAGASSASINAVVKAVVGRQRPPNSLRIESTSTFGVRAPRTSSFPSGHTLAAFCTAVLLADTPVEATAFVGFATAVALSRVHLKAHHASDVVGGAVLGVAVGLTGRRILGDRPPGVR